MEKQEIREKSEHWIRLAAVIEQAGMSTNYFARHIGLPVAENLYRIKRGQNAISRDVADRIVEKFPNISKGWLMTGEGCMYASDPKQAAQVPYYNKHIEEALSGKVVMPAYYIYVPMMKRCDFAVKYDDDTTNFDENILLIAAVDRDKLVEGKEYLFLIKNLLSLQIWSAGNAAKLDSEDRVFVVRGRLTIYKTE